MAGLRWYHWLLLPVVIAVAFLAYMMGRRNPVDIATEIEAYTARAEAARAIAEKDHEYAVSEIERRYHEKMERLTNDQAALADTLRGDPVALADWLARL